MHNANRFKLGLFGANCSSGRAVTGVPERWSGNWPDNLALARMADEAGIDFMLPIGRWKGYGGETDYQGETLESVAWATALLAHTRRMTVFATVHAPLLHPVIAAKSFVTADLVGEGRFGVNIVCGWNEGEFAMFGVAQRDHEARYAYGQEWIDAIRAMWQRDDAFDFDGEFLEAPRGALRAQALREVAAAADERGRFADRAGVRGAQLRCAVLDAAAGGDDRRVRRGHPRRQAPRRRARPRDRRLLGGRGDLPADDAGGRGVPSPLRHRRGRLGGGRQHPRDAGHPHPKDMPAAEFDDLQAGRSRTGWAASPSSAIRTLSPPSWPGSPMPGCAGSASPSSTTPPSCRSSAPKSCPAWSAWACARSGGSGAADRRPLTCAGRPQCRSWSDRLRPSMQRRRPRGERWREVPAPVDARIRSAAVRFGISTRAPCPDSADAPISRP